LAPVRAGGAGDRAQVPPLLLWVVAADDT
jgi:hypothetical protein